jgi:hypothetical protein
VDLRSPLRLACITCSASECTAEMKMATPQLNLVAGQTIDVEFSSSYLHGDLALHLLAKMR